jgi:hypothetical protein
MAWHTIGRARLGRLLRRLVCRSHPSPHSAARHGGPRTPGLEPLEDRTLLTAWTAIAPGALLNGQTPGGQPSSGRISALAADPTNPSVLYVGAAGGGVWKTANAGTTWTPLTDGQSTLFMGALAVAPSNPNVLYAGTGEANNSGDSYYGRGVLKSTDGGSTWSLLANSLFNRRTISRVVIDPTNANTVYVAVSDFGENGLGGNTGIWKSTDGGVHWSNTSTALPSISTTDAFSDLVIDPTNPQVLYAAVGTPGGGNANGVYKTVNGGTTWSVAGNFPLGTADSTIRLALAPSAHLTLYAAVTDPVTGGLAKMLKSTDGGAHWTTLANTPDYLTASSDAGQGDYDSTLAVDPANPNVVYAGGSFDAGSMVESTDGGQTWADIYQGADGNGPHADHHAIGFDAAGRLLDGNDGGLWRLDNPTPGSVHWTDLNGNLDTIQDYSVALDPTDPNRLYGASQDNGTDLYTGAANGTIVAGGDGGTVLVDPGNPARLYHTYAREDDDFFERSDDGGTTWAQKTTGINPNDPSNFYVPVVVDPARPGRLLLGTNHVYETTNGGDQWTAIGGPGSPGWTTTATIDSVAVAPTDSKTIYVSAGGHILVTTDHGAHWAQRDPVASPSSLLNFAQILVDPTNAQTAYAVAANFASDTGGGHVWRTTNGGQTWTNITSNLPDLPTWSIALDAQAATLYVGDDSGVYYSRNLGSTWSSLGTGLPHAQVASLALSSNLGILAAGTHGRGVWEIAVHSPAAATHFGVTTSAASAVAGTAVGVTVTALDVSGGVASGYTGTVRFTSSDAQAGLPAAYTFTAADHGVHTFPAVIFRTAGPQTVTAADQAVGSVTGTGGPVFVSPAAVDHLGLTAPAGSAPDVPFSVTVTAQDAFNNTVPGYTGTVGFTSSDPKAVLPAAYTFTAADAGTHTFSGVSLHQPGPDTITAADQGGTVKPGTATVAVSGAVASLRLTGFTTTTAGAAGSVTVSALDSGGNPVPSYTGTVAFGSSDPQAGLPASYTFVPADNGVHTFTITLKTAGSQSLTVSDTGNAALTASLSGIAVSPAAAAALRVGVSPAQPTAGVAAGATVTAVDPYGNTATGYRGTVTFTSSDTKAALPPPYTFTAADAGVHTWNVTFNTAGSQSLGVADGGTPPLSGSTTLTVLPGSSPGVTESFDGTAVGALPAGWAQWSSTGQGAFAVTAAQSLSPPNGLAVTAASSSLAARAWVAAPQPADVQVSASVYLGTLIPAQVLARGTNLNGATASYYALAVARGPQVQLVRVVNGVATPLAQLSSATYVSGIWARVTLSVVGSQLQAQVYRPDKQQYLTAAGQWQAAPAWALSVTDTTLTGPGQVGLARPASYAGTVVLDDFAAAAAGGSQSGPGPRPAARTLRLAPRVS